MMFADTAVRIRAAAVTDPYGNPSSELDWVNATRTDLPGVNVQPETWASREDVGDRETTYTGWVLYSRTGTDIDLLPTDRVEIPGGVITQVTGEVARWRFAGRIHHVEARLTRIGG